MAEIPHLVLYTTKLPAASSSSSFSIYLVQVAKTFLELVGINKICVESSVVCVWGGGGGVEINYRLQQKCIILQETPAKDFCGNHFPRIFKF